MQIEKNKKTNIFEDVENDDQDSTAAAPPPITDMIKKQVTNVLKLVDWSSSGSSPITTSDTTAAKNSESSQNQSETNSIKKVTTATTPSIRKQQSRRKQKQQQLDQSMHDTEVTMSTSSTNALPPLNEIQFNDLLEIDFGCPGRDIFNEFNPLHPYLSLYYLDYFTGISKMQTKLYCTTALMMSMMKENKEGAAERVVVQERDQGPEEEQSSLNHASRNTTQEATATSIGYTIGATNALFKQRLLDDVDAFIDEIDIDLRGGDSLKKQLQLSTADLRFIDFIVKNVNAAARADNKQAASTPTLLSFKKINSTSNIGVDLTTATNRTDRNENNVAANLSWEGSDDWIRLNFKVKYMRRF